MNRVERLHEGLVLLNEGVVRNYDQRLRDEQSLALPFQVERCEGRVEFSGRAFFESQH